MRGGGVSKPPYATLNSSFAVGDDAAAVRENLARLETAAGVEPSRLYAIKQVHGAVVIDATASTPETEGDALWTRTPGVAVGVRTADCVPVLIEDRKSGAVAAVHAGWRGVIAEITARTLEVLRRSGSKPDDLFVAIGPCIQKCCFEVDGDLPSRFRTAFGESVVVRPQGGAREHLDLPRAIGVTLERAQLAESHVVTLPQCTSCDPRFFSHRRDKGVTGRHLSFITCARAADL
jgi:YfiH family protein